LVPVEEEVLPQPLLLHLEVPPLLTRNLPPRKKKRKSPMRIWVSDYSIKRIWNRIFKTQAKQ